jgi:hypothetical protein
MLFTYLIVAAYIGLIMFIQLISNDDLKKTPYPWVVIVVSLPFCLIWPISLWGWLGMASKGLIDKVNENGDEESEEPAVIPTTHRLEHSEDVTMEGDRFFIYGDVENNSEAIHFVTLSQLMLKSGMTEDEAEEFLFVDMWARELDRTTFENLQRKCWRVWNRSSL